MASESLVYDSNTCVVCFKNVLYFSIGECDHPVCFECSTRMRVLCQQNECPICRQDLSKVVFTEEVQLYKDLHNKLIPDRLYEKQFKIYFTSEKIKQAYEKLLENCCTLCENLPPFRSFLQLNDHMRKVHERYFCDLCVVHLKIFTSERRCYTRQELAHHRRKGDIDNTSHRGHPLCEFCEQRFMDADELYRHLRKEHLFCHLCDADGKNLYYASHNALAQHFRKEHYLCEEGECAEQFLTSVFRSEIDLKAHKATAHNRGMPRGAARQARTLELQFNITPHPVVQRAPRDRDRMERAPSPRPSPPRPVSAHIDTHSDAQFPRLSTAPTAAPLVLTAASRTYRGADGLARNERNFPALNNGSRSAAAATATAPVSGHNHRTTSATVLTNSNPSVSIQLHSQPTSASNFRLTQATGSRITLPASQRKPANGFSEDFPTLGNRDNHPSLGASAPQSSKVSVINNQEISSLKNTQQSHSVARKPKSNAEDFPALSGLAPAATPPTWISNSKPKSKPVIQTEQPRQAAFNPDADFPTLPNNPKQKFTLTVPVKKTSQIKKSLKASNTCPPPPRLEEPKLTKKEKRKQNARKENIMEDMVEINGMTDNTSKEYLTSSVNSNNNSSETDRKIKTVTAEDKAQVTSGHCKGDFKMEAKDYPSLSSKIDNVPKRVTTGSYSSGLKARPACDGMTFTNSAGQTFSAPLHSYVSPPEFERRNRELVRKFVAALGGAEAVDSFKKASRDYRDGSISAEEFFQHCKKALGSHMDSVFPELVALLPDIEKQQELVVGRNFASKLDYCTTCGQVMLPSDKLAHDSTHWPSLSFR